MPFKRVIINKFKKRMSTKMPICYEAKEDIVIMST